MQYLAGGKPVIATDLPCIDEVLRHDVNGLVARSDDLDGLADAVVALLDDPARRAGSPAARRRPSSRSGTWPAWASASKPCTPT